ncbi:MAG: hypothetical protein ACLGIF_04775 [Actinomycetes bacterium]
MTQDRELPELEELARSVEMLADPLPPEQIRRLGTQRRRRRTALGAAAAVAAIALGSGVALSQTARTLDQTPDWAGTPSASPTPAPSPTPEPDGKVEPGPGARALTTANLLKASDVPVLGGQRVVVSPTGIGRPPAQVSLCFPDRGVAKLEAREMLGRNFAYRGGGAGGPSGEPTTDVPADQPTSDPGKEPTEPAPEPTEPPKEPTEPPSEPTSEPTEPAEEPTSPPAEPTPSPDPTVLPDEQTPAPGDQPTSGPGGGQTGNPGTEPTEPGDSPAPPPSVYSLALQFDSAAAAGKAYADVLDWPNSCAARLRDRGYRPLGTTADPSPVAVEVDGRRVGQFAEITYRAESDRSEAGWFESTGVTRVHDRLMITVSLVYGQDYNVSLDPDGDRQTGLPAHPQFALMTAAADRLAR